MAWDPSVGSNVTGYNLYYGLASGSYTQKIDVGPATSAAVNGLQPGNTYYFAATAYDDNGVESVPSNEASYIVPGTIEAMLDSLSKLHLIFPVAANHSYDLQTSSTLSNWTTIATIQAQANILYDFVNTNWSSAAQTFYRLVLH